MPFKKGQSGNPKGKLKGTKTQKTKAWEAIGEYLIGDGAERYKKYLLELSEKDFSVEFKAIIEYFKPKLNRTDLDLKSKSKQIERIYINTPDNGGNDNKSDS